jgi:hypothetical protein
MDPRPSGSILFMAALLLAAAISVRSPVSAEGRSHTQTQTIWSHTDDSGRDFSFILVEESGEALSGSGEMADYQEAERIGKQSGEDLVWARFDGHPYLILDKGVVAKVRKSMEPLKAVSEQQGKLGEQQGRLGEQQGRLGERQGRLGEDQARLAEREARISEKMARAEADGGSTKELQKELDAVRDEQDDLSRQQNELSRQQSALSNQQEPLSRQQQALGEQSEKLSRKMNEDVESMVREAVKSGLAVKQS